MNILTAICLGILQGLTEFLPVSSSGHLVIVQSLLPGFTQPGVLFDVLLHFGTILAVIVYFRHMLFKISVKYILFLTIGSLPAAVLGFLFKSQFEAMFSSVKLVGVALLITGGINLLTHIVKLQNSKLTPQKSLWVGLMQAVAIIPGVSRSGSTIMAGVVAGLSAAEAAKFSFLLSIPAVLGANLLELVSHPETQINWGPYLIAPLASFLTGLLAIGTVVRFLQGKQFKYFAVYCFIVGVLALVL